MYKVEVITLKSYYEYTAKEIRTVSTPRGNKIHIYENTGNLIIVECQQCLEIKIRYEE